MTWNGARNSGGARAKLSITPPRELERKASFPRSFIAARIKEAVTVVLPKEKLAILFIHTVSHAVFKSAVRMVTTAWLVDWFFCASSLTVKSHGNRVSSTPIIVRKFDAKFFNCHTKPACKARCIFGLTTSIFPCPRNRSKAKQ